MIDRFLCAVADLVTHRPRAVAAVLTVVTLGAIFGLTRFSIDSDYAAFLPDEIEADLDPELTKALFVVTTGDKIETVRDALRASPLVAEVRATRDELFAEAAAEARGAPLYFLPEESLERLATRLTTDLEAALAEMRDVLAEDPLGGRQIAVRDPLSTRWIFHEAARQGLPDRIDRSSPYLVSRDGATALLVVLGKKVPFDVEYSNALLEDLEARTDATLIGGYLIARADAARMKLDMIITIAMSITLVLLYLWRAMGSKRAAHVLVAPTVVAIVWTLGYGALLLGPLNPLVVSAATVLLGLGVDFAIHYATRYAEEGGDVRATCRRSGRLLLWSMLTGVAAFLTLLALGFRGLRTFGLLLAVGLCAAYVVTLFLLPLLLRQVPPTRGPGPVVLFFARFAKTRAARPVAAVLLLACVGGWLLVAFRGLPVDADPRRFRPKDDPVMAAQERFEKRLGFAPLPVTVRGFTNTGALAALDEFEKRGLIVASDGPHKRTSRDRVEEFRRKTAGWKTRSLAIIKALGLKPAPFRPALDDLEQRFGKDVDPQDTLSLYLPRSLWDVDERAAFHAELRAALGSDIEIHNPLTRADEVGPILRRELWKSFLMAGAAVVVLVLLFGRSVQALLPVVVGFGITLGVLSLFSIAIHPGNFVALPFLLGLGVDDGIHMAGRRREGKGDPLLTSGAAVWRTSATTLLAFGSLVFARTPAFASLGGMLALGIAACFVASVVVLPALWRH